MSADPEGTGTRGGLGPVLAAGLAGTTSRVQEMHRAIAGVAFAALGRVPGVAGPSRLVRRCHDAITDGVYATIRGGGSLLAGLVGRATGLFLAGAPESRSELALRSALNGVVGDWLEASANPLAMAMTLHSGGRVLTLDPAALAALRPHVCVLVHGLACSEHSWRAPGADADSSAAGADYGERLQRDLGVSALYLRYNSGLAIAENGRALATLLADLLAAAPQVRRVSVIGHSMGGLVARSACEQASESGAAWLDLVGPVICLGAPNRGARLEKAGQLATSALAATEITRPLARLGAARSRGIRDLSAGLPPQAVTFPLRLLAARLTGSTGDGLVTRRSALAPELAGDVERVELTGLGHLALLNHPRAYAVIRRWLEAADPQPRSQPG